MFKQRQEDVKSQVEPYIKTERATLKLQLFPVCATTHSCIYQSVPASKATLKATGTATHSDVRRYIVNLCDKNSTLYQESALLNRLIQTNDLPLLVLLTVEEMPLRTSKKGVKLTNRAEKWPVAYCTERLKNPIALVYDQTYNGERPMPLLAQLAYRWDWARREKVQDASLQTLVSSVATQAVYGVRKLVQESIVLGTLDAHHVLYHFNSATVRFLADQPFFLAPREGSQDIDYIQQQQYLIKLYDLFVVPHDRRWEEGVSAQAILPDKTLWPKFQELLEKTATDDTQTAKQFMEQAVVIYPPETLLVKCLAETPTDVMNADYVKRVLSYPFSKQHSVAAQTPYIQYFRQFIDPRVDVATVFSELQRRWQQVTELEGEQLRVKPEALHDMMRRVDYWSIACVMCRNFSESSIYLPSLRLLQFDYAQVTPDLVQHVLRDMASQQSAAV